MAFEHAKKISTWQVWPGLWSLKCDSQRPPQQSPLVSRARSPWCTPDIWGSSPDNLPLGFQLWLREQQKSMFWGTVAGESISAVCPGLSCLRAHSRVKQADIRKLRGNGFQRADIFIVMYTKGARFNPFRTGGSLVTAWIYIGHRAEILEVLNSVTWLVYLVLKRGDQAVTISYNEIGRMVYL